MKSKQSLLSQQIKSTKIKSWRKSKSADGKNKASKSASKQQCIQFLLLSQSQAGIAIPYLLSKDDIKKFIKSNGATWCPIFKLWKIDRSKYQFFRYELPALIKCKFEDPPDFVRHAESMANKIVIKSKSKSLKYEDEEDKTFKNHPLYQRLYNFQKESLDFCWKRGGRMLLADEMGVGKTVQALACSLLYIQSFPLLVICPSSLKLVWRDEIGKWLKGYFHKNQILIIKNSNSMKDFDAKMHKIVVISYEVSAKIVAELECFNIVICDEAHYLKNSDSKRTQSLLPYLTVRKRIILLTGTPALAKPRQLFNLLNILRPDIYSSLDDFGNRYCQLKQNQWTFKMQFEGSKNSGELHYLLKKTVMIRRLKNDVLSQLPPKQRQIVMMETQTSVVSQIRQLLNGNLSIQNIRNSQRIIEKMQDKANDQMGRCYMLSGIAKLQAVKEYIGAILENDVKILVFAHHKVVMEEIEQFLKKENYQSIRIDGDVSIENRKKKVDDFQNQFDIRVALLSLTAAGVGFTLTAASVVIFAELHWTPAVLLQAEDRTHRIGQRNSVNIHYLIGDKTLDPILLRQLQRKIGTVGQVLDGEKQTLEMQVIKKGQFGTIIEPLPQQEQKCKKKRITDYFKKKIQRKDNDQQEIGDGVIGKQDSSQDSLLIRLSKERKKQLGIL